MNCFLNFWTFIIFDVILIISNYIFFGLVSFYIRDSSVCLYRFVTYKISVIFPIHESANLKVGNYLVNSMISYAINLYRFCLSLGSSQARFFLNSIFCDGDFYCQVSVNQSSNSYKFFTMCHPYGQISLLFGRSLHNIFSCNFE